MTPQDVLDSQSGEKQLRPKRGGRDEMTGRRPSFERSPRPRLPERRQFAQARWAIAAVTALVVLGWLAAIILIDSVQFVVFNPRGKTGFEMFLALGQLFSALVLALSPDSVTRPRMLWVAQGLLILGLGALGFGYVYPLFAETPNLNVSMYGSLLVRTLATACIAIGMLPADPPALTRRASVVVVAGGSAAGLAIVNLGEKLPLVFSGTEPESLISSGSTRLPELTGWHLALSLIPLAVGMMAAWGTVKHYFGGALGSSLIVAIVLLAGSQLHSLFWPSMYSSLLTTTSVLRFGVTIALVVGAIFELRSLSLERAVLLAREQERVEELKTINVLKRDFSSMIAHELSSPLAAIVNMAQAITLGALGPSEQRRAATVIQSEARILQLLVSDIQTSAEVERDDFSVQIRTVRLTDLFEDAEAYADTVQEHHPLTVEPPPDLNVAADPPRIGQVIRNFLNNSVRHTPPGTPITLRALPLGDQVRIEVADRGPGIDPADRVLILEKFGRGSRAGRDGHGLGLYVSRRILRAHDTDVTVESAPGHGARFSFLLEVRR